MVVVISTLAYSIKKAGNDIAKQINGKVGNLGYYLNDLIVAVGNPDSVMARILTYNRKNVRKVYLIIEGIADNMFYVNTIRNIINMYKPTVYAPSKYVKFYLELMDIKVNQVLPHAVDFPPQYNHRLYPKKKVFSYASGMLERKYPYFLEPMFKKMKEENQIYFYIKGSGNVRYKDYVSQYDETMYTDSDISEYYMNIDVFVNLSGTEGFGMMPLEALSYGIPTIIPDIPIFRETILQHWNNYPLLVKSTSNFYVWKFGEWRIPVFEYDAMEMYEIMKQINDMNQEQYYDLKMQFIEKGRKMIAEHYPLSLYDALKL